MTEFPADRGEETRAKLRVRRMTAREQAIEAGAQADYDHDPKRMLCMDHDKQCCPSGDAHNMSHREARDHRVAAVLDAAEPIIRANERERSYGDAYREGWTESRADEAQRLAGQAASAELTRFEDGSLTISEIGPATEPGWVPVTPLLINALIDHAASARRAVAEEISQAIEAEARDEWTLGRDWVAVAAAIARRVGGASCSE